MPHDRIKQLWDFALPVTGFTVDGNRLLITMPDSSRLELLQAIDNFVTFKSNTPPSRRCRTLRECQALAGHVNWALNVFPRLRPGLASLYSKMGGPYRPSTSVHINAAIIHDLTWLVDRIRSSDGVFLLDSITWRSQEADVTLYTDACPSGLGFWCAEYDLGCYAPVISTAVDLPIFFHEASAVVCALHWLCQFGLSSIRRVVIYSDNTNTVDIFHSLKARLRYNALLQAAVDLLMRYNFDLCVLYIPGPSNTVADALSRCLFDVIPHSRSSLSVTPYHPPASLAGAIL